MLVGIIWLIGLFVVPKLVSPLEVGYGIVTVGALILWTVAMIILHIFI